MDPSLSLVQMLLQRETGLRRQAEEASVTSALAAESAEAERQQAEEQAGREARRMAGERRQ